MVKSKKAREKGIEIDVSKETIEKSVGMMDIADDLRSGIIGFVNDWLWARNMKVIDDDPDEEPVTTAGATMKGIGNVRLNFYFKKMKQETGKDVQSDRFDQSGAPGITQDW